MAWIQPNSDVYLLKNVPIDSSYTHTLYFNSHASGGRDTQAQAFMNFVIPTYGTYSKEYYQRVNKNTIKLAVLADRIYNCNYMMFRNTAYGNKWFYAFVKEVNYVNDNCTEVVYELDVMQTWYFDYEMGRCFVEREHARTDHFGENVVPENLEIGEQVVQNNFAEFPELLPTYVVLISYLPDQSQGSGREYITNCQLDGSGLITGNGSSGKTWNGVWTPCEVVALDMSTVSRAGLTFIMNKLADIKAEIVNVIVIPKLAWTLCAPELSGGNYNTMAVTGTSVITKSVTTPFISFGGIINQGSYYPKNNKLYTYPYSYIFCTNNKGTYTTLKYENFKSGTKQINVRFVLQSCALEMCATPYKYCDADRLNLVSMDFENAIVLNDFPVLGWSVDQMREYMARYGTAFSLSLISDGISTLTQAGIAGGSGNVNYAIRAGANAAGTALNAIGNLSKIVNSPSGISGQSATSLVQYANNKVGFTFYNMGLKPEMAKIIDNYFDMFGYAINEVKIPNVRTDVMVRPHWNYVKTGTCVIHGTTGGGLPADAEKAIENIYNNGITFWSNPSEVGDYSLDNKPAGWVAWG